MIYLQPLNFLHGQTLTVIVLYKCIRVQRMLDEGEWGRGEGGLCDTYGEKRDTDRVWWGNLKF
jgi:hypothetical protein